ncbi:BAG family molecular chaperone regulator 2-like [Glossina fuscipes fuscipes]
MLENFNFLGMFRKRRRLNGDDDVPRNNDNPTTARSNSLINGDNSENNYPMSTNLTGFWDSIFGVNSNDSDTSSSSNATAVAPISYSDSDIGMCVDRFVTVLDQLDARVEKFRKDALGLQEKRDFLLMPIDLIKSNDSMQNLTDSEREEIGCYLQRVNARLSTVELNVRIVRDHSQEDSLSQINTLIDLTITMGDPVLSRQRCQVYLNACCSAGEDVSVANTSDMDEYRVDVDVDAGPVDKKFESVLLGCTLDDQKNIKKRLHALMGYLNKQIIPQ